MRWVLAPLILWLASAIAGAQPVITIPFPGGQITPLTSSVTGTTGAVTATLTGQAGRWTYICGFAITSGGTTTATAVTATVTGSVSGTLNFTYVFVSVGQGVLGVALPGCIQSSAQGTNIVVNVPAGGTGTAVAVTAWGYLN